MAINNSDRDLLVQTLFAIFGEDYQALGRTLAYLETRFPTVAWRARFVALAPGYAGYISSGLSVTWFTTEVLRQCDAFKAGGNVT